MNLRIAIFIIGLGLLSPGCGHLFNKCGDNVLLGEFYVLNESIENWHPSRGSDRLVFKNNADEKLVMELVQDSSFMQVESGKTLCWEESWDTSSEYIRTEWIVITYAGGGNELEFEFHVGWHTMETNYEIEDLFDYVTFYSKGSSTAGTLDLVASDRGNNINPDILSYPSYVFADSLEINGHYYEDVWYFNREYPDNVFTPTLYVKKGIGVLGFRDGDNTVWVIDI